MPRVDGMLEALLLFSNVSAAVATTAFPLMYALSPWRDSLVGRALMWRSIAFAAAVDVSLIYHLFKIENWYPIVWVFLFSTITITNLAMCVVLWRINHKREERENHGLVR